MDVAPPFLKLQQCCILSSQIVSVRDIDLLFFLVRDIDQMVFETQELFPSQEVELRPQKYLACLASLVVNYIITLSFNMEKTNDSKGFYKES